MLAYNKTIYCKGEVKWQAVEPGETPMQMIALLLDPASQPRDAGLGPGMGACLYAR